MAVAMTKSASGARAEQEKKPSLLAALGLIDMDNRADWVDRHGRLRELAAMLPAALFVQLLAVTVMGMGAAIANGGHLPPRLIFAAAMTLAGALAMLVVLSIKPMRLWPSHHHAQLAVLFAMMQALGLSMLLWLAWRLPAGTWQIAGFVGTLGALGMTAVALHPARAALVGFAAVIVGSVVAAVGADAPSIIAGGCLLCLALATRRLALLDFDTALREARINDSGRLAAQLVREFETHGNGWFWQTDRHGNVSYLSPKVAEALTSDGVSPVGRPLTALFRMDKSTGASERTLSFHLTSRTSFSDYAACAASERIPDRWWSISGRPVMDALGRFQGFIGSGSDLTEKRRAEAEITRLALFDSLTGLANRQRMRLSLDQALTASGGIRQPTALFLLDLDRFKVVNDTMGHQTGDLLLKLVAQRLSRTVGEAGLVGRLGGDEFQVVLPGENDSNMLSTLARDIIEALSQPYLIDGTNVSIGCSIGIAIAPHDGDDSETLVRNADLALYAAKADGRGIHRFYRAELLHGAQSRKQMEDDLRQALGRRELYLVYQPVVSTDDAAIVGYEALLRWEHPVRGQISPSEFVPVAEDCGLIEQIGEWVLRTACADAATWPGSVRVGVNVSPIQFANPSLPAIITSALAKSGISPDRLELEITEGVFLDDSDATDRMFRQLKGIGVRLALDDFGTGYSSLGYLKSAPFDKIKIDQSFVRGATVASNRNAPIIKAIVMLADTLGMETTAEGVEHQDEIPLIRDLGCSHIQGFVYGRPIITAQVIEQLTAEGGKAPVFGYRVSRAPRTATIRSAILTINGYSGEVRIRNISRTGVMIDGVEFERVPEDLHVTLDLGTGQEFAARLRWAADGRAGLEFLEPFDLTLLAQATLPAEPRHMRKAG